LAEGFYIRKAEKKDMIDVFELSNDPIVRSNSISEKRIMFNEHKKWYMEKIFNNENLFLIAETLDKEFIG